MKIKILLLAFILLTGNKFLFPQWKQAGLTSEFLMNVTNIDSKLLVGGQNGIYYSTGTGIFDWQQANIPVVQAGSFIKYGSALLAAANSGLYESLDNGISWSRKSELPMQCILPGEDVWLAGIIADGVYRSTDKGRTWIYNPDYDSDSLSYVSSLLKVDDKILAVTQKGLQISTDQGLSWRNVDKRITGEYLYNNTLLASGDSLIAGGSGGVFISTDGGENWNYLGLNNVTNIIKYKEKWFAATMSGIYYSDDKEISWNIIDLTGYQIGWSFQCYSIAIYNDMLFAATAIGMWYRWLGEFEKPRIFPSINGYIDFGNVFLTKSIDTTFVITNRGFDDLIISGIKTNSPFISISPETAVIPPDSGQTFNLKISATQVGSIDANMEIFSNDLRGDIYIIYVHASVPAIGYNLGDNYPNPFNPGTTIEYQISDKADVLLEVYNLVGEKITTLVNGVHEPGWYKTNFTAINLPSGVYIYSMKAGEFTIMKKMIYIK